MGKISDFFGNLRNRFIGNVEKVPVILQLEALECGAASLAMILAHYKKFVPLEKLRLECSVSRDGCNAKNVLAAARHEGLVAKGFSFGDVNDLIDSFDSPCIIHWNFNHFVVLCGFKKDHAVISDPASGIRKIPMDEFEKSFTGIVLTFEPSKEFAPGGKKKSVTGFLLKRLKGSMVPLVFILLCGLVLTATGSVTSIFSKVFMDDVLGRANPAIIFPLLKAMALALVVSFIVQAFQSLYLRRIQGKMSVNSGVMFMWHVLRMPVEFFSQRFAGDIASRQASNDSVASYLCTRVAPVALEVVMLFVYLFIIISYDWLMSLVGIATALINLLILKFVAKQNENDNKALARDGGKLQGTTVAGISMIETIKASGAESGYFQKWIGYQTKVSNEVERIGERNAYVGMAPSLLQGFANLAITMLGVYNILTGKFTIGMLMAFQGFLASFLGPLNSLVGLGPEFQAMTGQMERIEDVMNYEADVEIDFSEASQEALQDKHFEKLEGNVDIRDLTFAYSPLGANLIEDFSLSVKKGQMVALVGSSGSGKSTIAKLVAGLYEPRQGEILFDGHRHLDLDQNVYRSSLAMVDQEVTMFQDTIRNNITMWDNTIEEEALVAACEDACIHESILDRADGYEHMLVENGKDFSGGQRQRFEIARAFVVDPTVMILDEATSALDPTTEKKVMDAVKRRGITCFIVAHRLSTIRDADEIIMLDHGHIVERGTHEELIAKNGAYANLVKSE